MILSMLKIQHVEQYSMLKSQYSMLKAKGIQHVERNTACWKREVSRWNEFITCRNELTACPLLTFKYPACARQVHLPVHAQQAQQWSLKKAPVKECSWSLKNAPGTAVVLEECSCARMLLFLEECSWSLKNAPCRMLLRVRVKCTSLCMRNRHSSGPWRMLLWKNAPGPWRMLQAQQWSLKNAQNVSPKSPKCLVRHFEATSSRFYFRPVFV